MPLASRKPKDTLAIVFMLLFLICSSETKIVGTNSSAVAWIIYTSIHYILFGLLLVYAFIKKGFKLRLSHTAISLILILSIIFFNLIITKGPNTLTTYLHICTIIINACLISYLFDLHKYLDAFEKSIFIIAIYSLIVYAMAYIMPNVIRSFPVIRDIADNEYYWTGLAIVSKKSLENGILLRSSGIFREPGVFQAFLNFSFIIAVFYKKDTRLTKIVIYILTIVSTISSTGIIALLLILILFTLSREVKHRILIIILLSLAVALFYYLSIHYEVFLNSITKLSNDKDPSTIARFYSLVANIRIWLQYPLIGSGMRINSILFPSIILQETSYYVADNTNTYLYLLSCFGVVPFFFFIFGLFRYTKIILRGKFSPLLFLIFLVILGGENFLYSSFYWVFVFYGLSINVTSRQDG